jgi:hypothetical protein
VHFQRQYQGQRVERRPTGLGKVTRQFFRLGDALFLGEFHGGFKGFTWIYMDLLVDDLFKPLNRH